MGEGHARGRPLGIRRERPAEEARNPLATLPSGSEFRQESDAGTREFSHGLSRAAGPLPCRVDFPTQTLKADPIPPPGLASQCSERDQGAVTASGCQPGRCFWGAAMGLKIRRWPLPRWALGWLLGLLSGDTDGPWSCVERPLSSLMPLTPHRWRRRMRGTEEGGPLFQYRRLREPPHEGTSHYE